MVFALTNDTDEQLTRLLVVPHFRFVGSGVVWPDLGSTRIATITASQGNPPEREDVAEADAFRLTIDPGTTVTYVAELRTPTAAAGLSLGARRLQGQRREPDALSRHRHRHRRPAGVVHDHRVRRARRAGVPRRRGARLGGVRLCLHRLRLLAKIFGFDDATERIWRAGVEAAIGATLIVFLFTYLNLSRWHARFLHIGLAWMLAMAMVVGLSVYNPPVAAGVARISIASVAAIGLMLDSDAWPRAAPTARCC